MKKTAKRTTQKAKVEKIIPQQLVIRVEQNPIVPTTDELAQPLYNGKNLTIPKTWLSETQLTFMLQKTPPNQIYRRPGKGGKSFDYVTGSYITKALNFVFAWNWDFEVIQHGKEADHVWVLGKLTVHGTKPGQQITKTQFGRSEVKYKKGTKDYVDYGNDLKAATTDALKKCASLLGFASDVYGKADYTTEAGMSPKEAPQITGIPQAPTNPTLKPGQILDPDGKPSYVCSECNAFIPDQVAAYSMKVFKKRLCRDCQATKK